MPEYTIQEEMFGKFAELTVLDVEPQLAKNSIESAIDEGLRLHRIFNFYDENSELSKLNANKQLQVSNDLLFVIKKGLSYSKLTKGLYDISLGRFFRLRKKGIYLQPTCSYENIQIKDNKVILGHKDAEIDLGSIAKGYIVDKMIANLKSQGILNGIIDARGDIRIFGNHEEVIAVQHPRENTIIKYVKIKNCAVATSGDYNQFINNYDKSHILNKKDLISVTVVAQDLTTADLLSTVIFVSSKLEIKKILSKLKNVKAMTIDKNLKIDYYNNFEEFIINYA